jgi:hypothetical protein
MDDPNSARRYFLVLLLSCVGSLWSPATEAAFPVVTRTVGAKQNQERMIVYALVSVEKNVLAEFAVEIGTSWSKHQPEFLIQPFVRFSPSSFCFPLFSLWQLSYRYESPLVQNTHTGWQDDLPIRQLQLSLYSGERNMLPLHVRPAEQAPHSFCLFE